jgi:hypothetical protein
VTTAIRCAYLASGAVLAGFTLTQGATTTGFPYGGGVYCQSSSSVISNCVLTWNSAGQLGGAAYNGTLINCVLFENFAGYFGGAAHNSRLINCTIVSNTATTFAAVNDCKVWNSIVYYNNTTSGAADTGATYFTNCCMYPMPSSNGSNIITNPPLFANLAAGDFHLQTYSPCINAGNNSFITNTVDLDGNPRVVGSAVDLGAYESSVNGIHYVSLTSATPVPPYTNWPTAATNIQDAVDISNPGELVLVTNGVYRSGSRIVFGNEGNRVVIDKALTVQSVNGPSATSIVGPSPAALGARCVYLTNGAFLSGFSLSNGVTRSTGDIIKEQSGGGVWCESSSAILSNCVIANNYAYQGGGGAYQGTLINCTLTKNQAFIEGGGADRAMLGNCLLSSNSVVQGSGGGGAHFGTLSNCLLIANSAGSGGGAYSNTVFNCTFISNTASFGGGAYGAALSRCMLTGNRATFSGGGMYGGSVNNSLLASNVAMLYGGGADGGNVSFTMNNCTVVGNIATNSGGGVFVGFSDAVYNSIIYYNLAFTDTNAADTHGTPIYYCCSPTAAGARNLTNPPVFVDFAGGNYRLQTNSPCINSGKNSYVPPGPDLDGNPRIVGGTVDIGAYEFPTPTSVISYAWLQQFGLATDGSADFTDSDGDGMSNYKEWRCQTSPIDPTSALRILSVVPNGTNGNIVTWQSVEGLLYYLQRSSASTNGQFVFSPIKTNIVGLPGTTSYTDKTATGAGPYFYRIQVP